MHLSPWLNAEQSAQYSTQWPEIAVINPASFDLKTFTFVKLTHSLGLLLSGNFMDFDFLYFVFFQVQYIAGNIMQKDYIEMFI